MNEQEQTKSYYVEKNGRLALFKTKADERYWDKQWLSRSSKLLAYALRPNSSMASHGPFFRKWLPNNGFILEAGCGTGIWVQRFRIRGYNCIGLDFAMQTLQRTRRIVSDLPLIGGDVFQLPFANDSLSAIVSFGVVEHFSVGPSEALKEISRVLRPGGVGLISVPYENPFRCTGIKRSTEEFAISNGTEFYQYYFKPDDFLGELNESGLTPKANSVHYYGVYIGLQERSQIMRRIIRSLPLKSVWTPLLDFLPYFSKLSSHMLFAVCEKL